MPFSRIHDYEEPIVRTSTLLGRTPSALAMKMLNFARFDPSLRARNVGGLGNGAKSEEAIWNEFFNRWEDLANASDLALQHLSEQNNPHRELDLGDIPAGRTERRMTAVRSNQSFFRNSVLGIYQHRCCITGLNETRLLVASHIKPWAVCDPQSEQLNPRNGLCLNSLHDKAFDSGLITLDDDYRIVLSTRLHDVHPRDLVTNWFEKYEGQSIDIPDSFCPDTTFLKYHRENVFLG